MSAARSPRVLLTGATGNLGFAVLREVLERREWDVVALVRRGGDQVVRWLLRQCGIGARETARLSFVIGDVVEPLCGTTADDPSIHDVEHVIHCAALTRWDAPARDLLATNVAGTRHLLDFAEELHARRRLHRITVVSSAYVSGRREEHIPEAPLPMVPFNNPYEASKFLMEHATLARKGLPVNVVRPSIIVGDSRDGVVQNFSTIYFPFRLVMLDQLFVLPGRRESLLDIVPADYVARVILALHEHGVGPGEIVHASSGAAAVTLEDIWHIACDAFDASRPLAARRRPKWFLGPRVAAAMCAAGALVPGRTGVTLGRMALYIPYLNMSRRFADDKARALGVPPPPRLHEYARTLCRFAADADFRSARQRIAIDPSSRRVEPEPLDAFPLSESQGCA